jgi:Aspartyl protease
VIDGRRPASRGTQFKRTVSRSIAYAVILAPAALAAAPARMPTVLSADAETRWVPFTLTATNQIRFTAMIDGRPVVAILDTGVSHSVLSQHYVDAARITRRPFGTATAIGGAVDLGWAEVGRIGMGGLSRAGGGLAVAVLPEKATGAGVDLLVGRDLTGDYALDIDYAARRFRLIASGRLPFRGESAPLTIGGARALYLTEITLAGARLRPMVVDTGDGGSITVNSLGWQAAGQTGVPMRSTDGIGLGGRATSRVGMVAELWIGPISARDVEVLVEPPGGFSDTIEVAGRIGSGFLRNYRVLLDPRAGRMVLRPLH